MTEDLPKFCLTIRQPWCHFILHHGKRHENRKWPASYWPIGFRGEFLLHAATHMTVLEYCEALAFAREICGPITIPHHEEIQRGGIVGRARVAGIVKESDSKWFTGPIALVLEDVRPVPFIPCPGRLGFFPLSSVLAQARAEEEAIEL